MTLDEIRALCDQASKGPWKADHYSTVDGWGEKDIFTNPDGEIMKYLDEQYRKDRAFIAAARTLLPALLAVAEAAEGWKFADADLLDALVALEKL